MHAQRHLASMEALHTQALFDLGQHSCFVAACSCNCWFTLPRISAFAHLEACDITVTSAFRLSMCCMCCQGFAARVSFLASWHFAFGANGWPYNSPSVSTLRACNIGPQASMCFRSFNTWVNIYASRHLAFEATDWPDNQVHLQFLGHVASGLQGHMCFQDFLTWASIYAWSGFAGIYALARRCRCSPGRHIVSN